MWKRLSSSQDSTLPSFFLEPPRDAWVFRRVFYNSSLGEAEGSSPQSGRRLKTETVPSVKVEGRAVVSEHGRVSRQKAALRPRTRSPLRPPVVGPAEG